MAMQRLMVNVRGTPRRDPLSSLGWEEVAREVRSQLRPERKQELARVVQTAGTAWAQVRRSETCSRNNFKIYFGGNIKQRVGEG